MVQGLQQDDKRQQALFNEMASESDRGCILVGASVLEELLEEVIQVALSQDAHVKKHAVEPLFGSMGPLSTFSAKIKLTYSLGLIKNWCFADLEKIRKIRNAAAHEYSSKTFANHDVINITCTLQGADLAVCELNKNPFQIISAGGADKRQLRKNGQRQKVSKERLRFTLTVIFIAGYLDGLVLGKKEILSERQTMERKPPVSS